MTLQKTASSERQGEMAVINRKEMRQLTDLLAVYQQTSQGIWEYDGMHDEIHEVTPGTDEYFFAEFWFIDRGNRTHDEYGHRYTPYIDWMVQAYNAMPILERLIKQELDRRPESARPDDQA